MAMSGNAVVLIGSVSGKLGDKVQFIGKGALAGAENLLLNWNEDYFLRFCSRK